MDLVIESRQVQKGLFPPSPLFISLTRLVLGDFGELQLCSGSNVGIPDRERQIQKVLPAPMVESQDEQGRIE